MIGMWSLTQTQPALISRVARSGPVDVAGPGRGGQPVGGVVGQRDALVVGVEGQHDQDRAEDLVLDDLAVLGGVGDERRLVVGARRQVTARAPRRR